MMHRRRYSFIFILFVILYSCSLIITQDVEAQEAQEDDIGHEPSETSTNMPEPVNDFTYNNIYEEAKTTTNDTSEKISDWEKNQRVQAQQEARRKRKQKEREKDNLLSAKRTLQAAMDETCDWRAQPLALIRGEVCGSYYKVLGLDRKRGIVDKADIKKAYRQKSLNVHPGKDYYVFLHHICQ
jgi:hypothetical protein